MHITERLKLLNQRFPPSGKDSDIPGDFSQSPGNLTSSKPYPVTNHCDIHGEFQGEAITLLGKTFYSACPKCAEIYTENEKKAQEKAEQERLKHQGISTEHLYCTLENFIADSTQKKLALNSCRDFTTNTEKLHLLLLGKPGTGKTHLAAAIVKTQKTAKLTTFPQLLRDIRNNDNPRLSADIALTNLSLIPLLAIDELGIKTMTEADNEFLFELIDNRHKSKLKTIYISNLNSNDFKTWLNNERITDRLAQHGTFIALSWKSFRKKAEDTPNL
jgi:DNA replication protein DnaC